MGRAEKLEEGFALHPRLLRLALLAACGLAALRLTSALLHLREGDPNLFLEFPLAVVLPLLALAFLTRLPGTKSAEGALMRLAALLTLLLILALPPLALHLALGAPVAFLCVELYVLRTPPKLRARLERLVFA